MDFIYPIIPMWNINAVIHVADKLYEKVYAIYSSSKKYAYLYWI